MVFTLLNWSDKRSPEMWPCKFFRFVEAIEILLSHLGVTIIACLLILKLQIRSESLLVIPSVGINVTYANRLGQVYTEFYPRQLVMDLVIVEAIIMQKLATYPVILYHDSFTREMKIKPLFMKCRLKMAELKSIYQKVQKNLRFTSLEKKSWPKIIFSIFSPFLSICLVYIRVYEPLLRMFIP